MPLVSIHRKDTVVVLTLNRPDRLNALDVGLFGELLAALVSLEEDRSVRAAILTGAGEKAFAAGADIAAMKAMSAADAQRFAELGQRVAARIEEARIPFIAAVNGVALGGGCELALACDLIYASDKARLGQPEVNLGLIPGFGGTYRLARRIGVGRAQHLCMTGTMVSADDALRIGLVDAVIPHAELLSKVSAIAASIAAKPPLAVSAIKRVILCGADATLPVANALEAATFGALFATEDQREGVAAFLEKRPGHFTGK